MWTHVTGLIRRLFRPAAVRPIVRRRPRLEALEDRTVPTTLPTGFAETTYATGLSSPTAMEYAPDGKLFVTEKAGTMKVFSAGTATGEPASEDFFQFALAPRVDAEGERGLLSVTFDPNYATNRFVYVYYTVNGVGNAPSHNRVSRFTANAAGTLALAGSEFILLDLENLSNATNHNGGALHFGLHGKLYVAVGENANPANSQTLANRLGKILRINSDGSIPTDNPFFNQAVGLNRSIFALGFRNPYTFAVQPTTNRIYVNDVGGGGFEEVNVLRAGGNYGWDIEEGPGPNPNLIDPLYSYSRQPGGGTAVTGAVFAQSGQFPPIYNGYFFADYIQGFIRRIEVGTGRVFNFAAAADSPVDLDVAPDGSLMYLSIGSGSVMRIRWAAPPQSISAFIVAGSPRGQASIVRVIDAATGLLKYSFQAYAGAEFNNGVRVAAGDVTGDRIPDIITASLAPGARPLIKVFDGRTRQQIRQYFVAPPSHRRGLLIALADTDRNGVKELLVRLTGQNVVRRHNPLTGQLLGTIPNYPFPGLVVVARG